MIDLLETPKTLTRETLQETQFERLRWTLKHAHDNCRHYRRQWKVAGVHPDEFTSLEDLARFPFTTKEDFRLNYPFEMFAVPRAQVVRIHCSSGTTGKSKVVGYTQKDIDTWADLCARCIAAAGGKPGDMLHNAYGYGLFTGGLGVHYGGERLGCTVIPMSGGMTERQVQLIHDFEPDIITCTPSYMLALADEFERQGFDPRKTSLRIAIHGAEPWTESMRGEIESRFDLDAIDIYGLTEIIGPGVANESAETKDGSHIWEDHFYPEIIHPETGEPLPDGEWGELVFTSLTKEACPIIRYRTRDLTRLEPGTAFPAMRRMARITGRADDMLIIRGVNVFPSQVEELILRDPERLAPHYVIEVRREGRMDEMTVRVETRPGFADAGAMAAAAHDLRHHIKSHIGVSAKIDLQPAGALERSLGKAKRVFDLRT